MTQEQKNIHFWAYIFLGAMLSIAISAVSLEYSSLNSSKLEKLIAVCSDSELQLKLESNRISAYCASANKRLVRKYFIEGESL